MNKQPCNCPDALALADRDEFSRRMAICDKCPHRTRDAAGKPCCARITRADGETPCVRLYVRRLAHPRGICPADKWKSP
jgi:hypothetical protein